MCFTAELLSGCEKLLISKEGGKAGRENHPWPRHSPLSTPVASSSFRGLCRHHRQDPENFIWFIYSLTKMKNAHGKKNTEIISQSTPPRVSTSSCETSCCKNHCCKFQDHQPSFLSQRKIQSKTPPRWSSGWEDTFLGSTICPDLREYNSCGFRHTLLSPLTAQSKHLLKHKTLLLTSSWQSQHNHNPSCFLFFSCPDTQHDISDGMLLKCSLASLQVHTAPRSPPAPGDLLLDG